MATLFEVLAPHLGKKIEDVIENTIIEQHKSAKSGESATEAKRGLEYLIVFEDGERVRIKG